MQQVLAEELGPIGLGRDLVGEEGREGPVPYRQDGRPLRAEERRGMLQSFGPAGGRVDGRDLRVRFRSDSSERAGGGPRSPTGVPGRDAGGTSNAARPYDARGALVGRELTLKLIKLIEFIEVDVDRDHLILSERAAAQELRRRRKAQTATELFVGDIREGTVTQVTGFGLFADIEIADGLVHRSEITPDKALNPMSIHAVGDRVRVLVTAIEPQRDRISLSIKRLAADPWWRVGGDVVVGRDLDATIRG